MTEKDKYQLLLEELIGPLKGFVTTLTKKSELLANKVKSIIGNEDSDEKYPTVKAVYKFVCESIGNISFDGYEITKNKVKKLDDTSTDEQYPSAKSVYDELQKFNSEIILEKSDFVNGVFSYNYGISDSDIWLNTPNTIKVSVGYIITVKPSEGYKYTIRILDSPDLSIATKLKTIANITQETQYISEFDGYLNAQVGKSDGTNIVPEDYEGLIKVNYSRIKAIEESIKDISIPKKFERIATYTVIPDSDGSLPTKITINKDDDGNPFELTDVYCDVLIGLTDGLTGRFYVSVGNPSERNMINVIGNATLNIDNTQLRKWCFRVDNYGDGRGGLTSAPSVSLMHTTNFPSANVSTMYGQPIPVWRTIDIREVQFVGQAGNTQTFMEGTTITLWGVRKQ